MYYIKNKIALKGRNMSKCYKQAYTVLVSLPIPLYTYALFIHNYTVHT